VKVEICFTAQELTPSLAYGKTIVILDIFRTSSTIITALPKEQPESFQPVRRKRPSR
jgi:hypothetical protein